MSPKVYVHMHFENIATLGDIDIYETDFGKIRLLIGFDSANALLYNIDGSQTSRT